MTDLTEEQDRVEIVDDIGLIILASPPVNALARPLREAMITATDRLNATPEVRVIAVLSDLHVFSAGADIREFSRPLRRPYLQDVCANLEASHKPVVAVLHGAAFGGGLGIAMASHARVALPGTRLGLTEVHVGILPGAGGTQRTPRLTGVSTAIDLIVSGRKFDAAEGLAHGIIDRIMPGTPRAVALQAAKDVLSGALPT
ncbi:MAG: enoyl-CoA hydratase/isomerase family protein, partial [Gemmobacter sp.]|nr:enoyl-CoA hydratase/isomerase family protein [Gemmobacter sp.]